MKTSNIKGPNDCKFMIRSDCKNYWAMKIKQKNYSGLEK